MVVFEWIKRNWSAVALAVALAAVLVTMVVKRMADDTAANAEAQIEASDMEALPSAVVAPARVERASRRVRDEVESEIDDAMAQAPEDPVGSAGLAVRAARGDDAFRSGIERLRDKASRY